MNIAPPAAVSRTGLSVCPHDCPSACALEVDLLAPDRIGRVVTDEEQAALPPVSYGVL